MRPGLRNKEFTYHGLIVIFILSGRERGGGGGDYILCGKSYRGRSYSLVSVMSKGILYLIDTILFNTVA